MKLFFLLGFCIILTQNLFAQSAPSELEKKLTDSICTCMTQVNVDKINSKKEAVAVFTDCFTKHTDFLMKLATEKNIDPTDNAKMRDLGIEIGKQLLNQNCAAFTKISVKMVAAETEKSENAEEGIGSTTGKIRRIDMKGFNYIVATDKSGSEKSFLWLRQFPGSEKFANGVTGLLGKPVKITWHELEVYLPQAKGYYKVKEITAVDFL
ncbi:hypothetical protein [Mucilaginibacter sp.]|uniref:hypothetical protein n=2 Tax=Mucilaginibacter sp. TaxID=1882438 RepID=UPI00374CFC12